MPAWVWKSRTAVVVAEPNWPSTVRDSLRLALSSTWSALTASPVAPAWSVGVSAPHVWGPTMPSTPRPLAVWKARTAVVVALSNTLLMGAAWPAAVTRYWMASTSAPRLPLDCVGKNAFAYACAGTAVMPVATSRTARTVTRWALGASGCHRLEAETLMGGRWAGEAFPPAPK